MRSRALSIVAFVTLLTQACAGAPSVAPTAISSGIPSGAPATPTQTPSAAPASDLPSLAPTDEPTAAPTAFPTREPSEPDGPVSWERVLKPERGLPLSGISDRNGWIVVGAYGRIWRSGDGRTWSAATVENADGAWLSGVTRRGDSYFAAGTRCVPEDDLARSTGVFWRSDDGRDWQQVGSIDLGSQNDDCAVIEHLAATGSGLVATLQDAKAMPSGAIYSEDGTQWTEISKEAFNLAPDPNSLGTTAFVKGDGPETLLFATCRECPVGVWGTSDGLNWAERGSIDEAWVIGLSPALGNGLVVAAWVCPEQPCHTSIWIRGDDGSFERVRNDFLLDFPELTYTGREYLLVGIDSTNTQGMDILHAFTSIDGVLWREIDTMAHEECRPRALIGGDSSAVFLGEHDCRGIWRVEIQP